MKVGIVSTCQYSVFSGGLANTTIVIYEMMKVIGHEVTILNTEKEWYDDCKTLKEQINIVSINGDSECDYDFLIELVPYFQSIQARRKIGKRSVFLNRHNILLPTIESSLYPIINIKHNYDGVDEIWCFKELCDDSEKQLLEVLTRKPVVLLPYIWTPSIVEIHKNETQLPLWLQISQLAPENTKWSPHIFETNTTSASSSTIPLLILRQAKLNNFPVNKYKAHNIEQINKSQFFKDNVLKHCEVADLSGEFVGRQRIIDLIMEPMSFAISHIRFIPFKPMLFDMAWAGIPFIHNSSFLKHISCFERYYYPDNKISEAVKCLETMRADFVAKEGWFKLENIQEFRKYILENHSCFNPAIIYIYRNAVENSLSSSYPSPSPPSPSPSNEISILFTDMWENFNYSYNFFTLLLENANPSIKIKYYTINTLKGSPTAIICGPFGSDWKLYPNVPKIHYTGENTPPIAEASLNLGFAHVDMVGENYLRLPLWILEIDWFGCDINRIANPKPIPLNLCTNVPERKERKFCAFVVSNPSNELRNKAFTWLNTYKPVDSAGRLYNNVGDHIFAGAGGGGGEHKKVEFLRNYKFCIVFENSSSQGYVTEKLLHAKAAGCIPIYWGDPKVERDFDKKTFIDARKIKTKEDLISLVKEIDENDEKYLDMYNRPALDDYHVDWARRTMAECASRIFKILGVEATVPRFIDYKETPIEIQTNEIETPLVVTYATRQYLPSVNQWLTCFAAQKKLIPEINALIYLGHDVSDESKKQLVETFPFIRIAHLPEAPSNFPDIFEGGHFAWKIYIYKTLANDDTLKNKMIFYMDAGIFMCRWPTEYIRIAQHYDICVLTDEQQFNKQWCHDVCVHKMNITTDELEENQIAAGIMCFRVGEKAKAYFNEAWSFAQQRDVIVGEKWSGVRDGKPYGHRHDQSILSILSLRHSLPKYPLHNLYCDISLRRTFITNKYLYVHRGNFVIHDKFLDGIDDCFVISLKRRADRLEKLYAHSPEFKGRIIEHEAYDGRNIQMSDSIARLFKTNDFMWKKAVMGCALSHLSLWYKLASDKSEINNYLILEDDVKFLPNWQKKWLEAVSYIPENYDIIYLGGILPPNREGFETVKEKINPYFSKIKKNQFFGQGLPTSYFHFCAYSYVLSKQGAQKIIQTIMARGYYTSADHILCNPVDYLNIYFLDPLVSGCYQDDDPVYANAEFNNFNRIDNFDSDLWNNDERFKPLLVEGSIDISKALGDARLKIPVEVGVRPSISSRKFYTLYPLEWNLLYEKKWLLEIFGKDYVEFERISLEDTFENTDISNNPIFIVLRDQPDYEKLFAIYEEKNIKFSIIHLSDEFGSDNIDFYKYSCCISVIRNYRRDNLDTKVFVLPLGYHNGFEFPMKNPYERTPQIPFRKNLWSFFGTDWKNRTTHLEPLKKIQPNDFRLFGQWNDQTNTKEKEYISILLDSLFVPCLEGNNAETFRFYEALECGCIPIVVENEFTSYIMKYIPLFALKTWDQAPLLIMQLLQNKETLENYRLNILKSYSIMKHMLQNEVRKRLNLI